MRKGDSNLKKVILLVAMIAALLGIIIQISQIKSDKNPAQTETQQSAEEEKADEPLGNPTKEPATELATNHAIPTLSEKRKEHIIHGSESGGGHLFGTGKPCKSEFPSSWDETKIISSIQEIAANDNLEWKQENNGYFVADSKKDGVRIRVVLNGLKTEIITGYPTNMPRNPCGPAANDNVKVEQAPIKPD